jgi:hypothetical protein
MQKPWLLLALAACTSSSSASFISSGPSTPADRCHWVCDIAETQAKDRLLSRRGPIDMEALQAIFDEDDRCRATCGD